MYNTKGTLVVGKSLKASGTVAKVEMKALWTP